MSGFLHDWEETEKEILINNSWETTPSSVDGGQTETFNSKVVLPTLANVSLDGWADVEEILDIFGKPETLILPNKAEWFLRNAANNATGVKSVNDLGDEEQFAASSSKFIRPLVNISPDTLVYQYPDENGVYSFCFEKEEGQ